MTAGQGARGGDPYPEYDVRLDGDPGSCHAAAAQLRSEAARLRTQAALEAAAEPAIGEVTAACAELAAALDRFAQDLRRAQEGHRGPTTDVARNAALALAGRARRRLRLACADVLPAQPPGGIRFRP